MDNENKKETTLDDLALMVAKGFENTANKDDITQLTGRMDVLTGQMGVLTGRMDTVEHQMQALNSDVNNYLELSEK